MCRTEPQVVISSNQVSGRNAQFFGASRGLSGFMGIGFRVEGCSSGEPKALRLPKGVATRSRRRLLAA
jgi:hypothetical protein